MMSDNLAMCEDPNMTLSTKDESKLQTEEDWRIFSINPHGDPEDNKRLLALMERMDALIDQLQALRRDTYKELARLGAERVFTEQGAR